MSDFGHSEKSQRRPVRFASGAISERSRFQLMVRAPNWPHCIRVVDEYAEALLLGKLLEDAATLASA